MSLLEIAVAASLIAASTVFSSRCRYWTRMVLYFVMVQIIGLVMLPVAIFNPGNPRNFMWGSRIMIAVRSIFGTKWQLHGKENIKDKAYIVVSNHQSSVDVLGMLMNWEAFNPVVPVMKAELKYALAFGAFCSLSGAVFIDRGSEKGRLALQKGLEAAKKSKKSVWIFPEGTRNHTDSKLLPFKKGAFHMAVQAQMPILPVVFSDYSSFYSRSEQRFDSGFASMTVLPEISTDGLTAENVTDLAERTRTAMMDCINSRAAEPK